jgi:hypothetical protein
MRQAIKWAIRVSVSLLSVEFFVLVAGWSGRFAWLGKVFAAYPRLALIFRGPLLSLICLAVCLLALYGREYLKWPDIHAEILRVELHPKLGLVPVKMMDEIFQIAGKESYTIDCDLMTEVFLVNRSETEVTIREFSGAISTKGKKNIPLARAKDFDGYTLRLEKKTHGPGSFSTVQTTYNPLRNLLAQLSDVPLKKGIGHQGWLGFTVKGLDRKEAEKVTFKLHIMDALGHKHPITTRKGKVVPDDESVLVGPIDG